MRDSPEVSSKKEKSRQSEASERSRKESDDSSTPRNAEKNTTKAHMQSIPPAESEMARVRERAKDTCSEVEQMPATSVCGADASPPSSRNAIPTAAAETMDRT